MHRIDTPTAQVDKFGTGKNGFTNGDPSTGRRATDLNSDMWDAVQEEICNTIEKSGLTLNKAQHDQLYQAIVNMITASVPDALLRKNNLSDLIDKVAARTNLGLGEIATHASGEFVSAGGGTYNKTYKLGRIETVPTESNMSALYNVQAGVGGIVSGVEFHWQGHQFNIGITRDAGTGTNGLVFQHNGYTRLKIDENGNLNSSGTLSANGSIQAGTGLYDTPGVRVYSPNNPPNLSAYATTAWVNSNFLSSARRGGQAYQPGTNDGSGMIYEAPAGCYLTGINTKVTDGRGMGVYYRAFQVYYPSLGYVQIGD